MLVCVAVDCDALDVEGQGGPRAWQHERLVNLLSRHGALVRTSGHDLRRMLSKLDVNSRKLWDAFLPTMRWMELGTSPPCLCSIVDRTDFTAHWAKSADLAVVEEARGVELGLAAEDKAALDPATGIELVHLETIELADAITRTQDLAERYIQIGERREDVWRDRFHKLSSARTLYGGKRVAICDRYAGANLARAEKGRKAETGLAWVLRRFCEYPISHIHLILGAEYGERDRTAEAVQRLVTRLAKMPKCGLGLVELTLVPDDEFSKLSHDRFVRFDGFAVGLGQGMEVFDGPVVAERSTCHRLNGKEARKVVEDLEVAAKRWGWPGRMELRQAP